MFRCSKTSPVAITKPVGGPPDQPDYTNQVIKVRTTLGPHELLDLAQRIEANHHRTRQVRWEARTLDLDLITYDQLELDDERLTLPHPRGAYSRICAGPVELDGRRCGTARTAGFPARAVSR